MDADVTPGAERAARDDEAALLGVDPASATVAAAAERSRMRASTTVFAIATIFSRLAGMLRSIGQSALFGVQNASSAFTVAFQIPNLIRAVVADAALGAAFVPIFTELKENGEEERAWRVASTVIGMIILLLVPLMLVAMLAAPWIVQAFVSQSSLGSHYFHVAITLTRILMPIVVLFALNGAITGILNSYDRFGASAFAPVAWNVVIFVSLAVAAAVSGTTHRLEIYTVGTLIGTMVQLALPLPWLRGLGGRIHARIDLRDPKVREILVLMLPVTLSLGLINLQQLIDTAFSTHIPHHLFHHGVQYGAGPAIIANAFLVYMLPQGVFSVAVSTVLFPALSRYAARGDRDGFRDTFSYGLRQIFTLLIPSAAFIVVFATPIVRLLFQHGHFTADQTPMVASALAGFSFGLVFNGASLLLIRSFFSLKQTWLPTTVSVLTMVVNALFDWLLYTHRGVQGITLATSIVNVVSFVTLFLLLRRRFGRLDGHRIVGSFAMALAAAVVAVAVASLAWHVLDAAVGRSVPAQLLTMVVAVGVTGGLYLTFAVRLRLIDRAALRSLARRSA